MQQSQECYQPEGRRGACSFVHNGSLYLYGGALSRSLSVRWQLPQVAVETLDFQTGVWSSIEAKILDSLPQSISGACSVIINNNFYIFGGWLGGLRNAQIHELNLDTLRWRKLPIKNPKNGPMCKDKAGMFEYGDNMIGVFGGYGYPEEAMGPLAVLEGKPARYHLDPNSLFPIGWTNELHLFHLEKSEWIVPVTTGIPPPPCAAFSLTRVDPHRLVLFGGKQLNQRVNELYILDLNTWHWSGVYLPSRPEEPWPTGRSFHTACSLVDPAIVTPPHPPSSKPLDWLSSPIPDLSSTDVTTKVDPKLIVLWGMDNNANPINDAWELNVNTLTWKRVQLPEGTGPGRAWHTAAAHYPSPCEAVIVSSGGTALNMFTVPENDIVNVSKTTVLHCGVYSLVDMCFEYFSRNATLLSIVDQLPIPAHLQQQIQQKARCSLDYQRL